MYFKKYILFYSHFTQFSINSIIYYNILFENIKTKNNIIKNIPYNDYSGLLRTKKSNFII